MIAVVRRAPKTGPPAQPSMATGWRRFNRRQEFKVGPQPGMVLGCSHMAAPQIISYRSTTRIQIVPTVAGNVEIAARRDMLWTSQDSNKAVLQPSLIIRGEITEKNLKYPVEWKIDLSREDLNSLLLAVETIEFDLGRRKFALDAGSQEFEVQVHATDRITLGWIARPKAPEGFAIEFSAQFSQGDQRLRATFENFAALKMLYQAHA
jgi:hypothetical protein